MSNASRKHFRKTGKKKTERELSRPFDPKLMARAEALAARYSLVIQPNRELGFMGSSVEFPTVFTHGATVAQCARTTREALAVAVAVMLEQGQTPPAAASEERRDQQINVRLTAEERLLLESAAKRRGFRGISDFVRTAALAQTRAAG